MAIDQSNADAPQRARSDLTILGRIARRMHSIDAVYSYRRTDVVCLCRSVDHNREPCSNGKRLNGSYGMCIHLRQPMNHILNAGGGTPTGKGHFEEEIWYSCPAVDILKVTHKAQQEVAMRPSRRRYLGIFLPTLIRAR